MHSMWSPTHMSFTPSATLPSLIRYHADRGQEVSVRQPQIQSHQGDGKGRCNSRSGHQDAVLQEHHMMAHESSLMEWSCFCTEVCIDSDRFKKVPRITLDLLFVKAAKIHNLVEPFSKSTDQSNVFVFPYLHIKFKSRKVQWENFYSSRHFWKINFLFFFLLKFQQYLV